LARVEAFALDIPQGLVYSRKGAHQDGTAPVKCAPVEFLPDVLDTMWILTKEIVHHFMDRGLDGVGFAFEYRFPPADDAFVRFNFQEEPAGWDNRSFVRGYLHGFSWLGKISG
jgi:hypothetical protein